MNLVRSWPLVAAVAAIVALPATAARVSSRTIVVTSVTVKLVTHDTKPKGPSKGDTVVYHDRLLNAKAQFGKKKGAKVGTDSGTLRFTGPHTATFKGETKLPGGTLTLSGDVYTLQNGDLVIPVSSGTGAFAGMSGTLTVGTGENHVRNTYTLKTTQIA
jgi:autotransporter-associated beta strand protein